MLKYIININALNKPKPSGRDEGIVKHYFIIRWKESF